MLDANEEKKHLAPDFKRRLDKLGLIRLYVQIGYSDPKVLSRRNFQRRIARLSAGRLSARDEEYLMDFEGNRIDRSGLTASANTLEAEVRKAVGKDNTYGTVVGRIAPGKATFCRTATDDTDGVISVYVGEGQFTNDKLDTFGGYGVMKIANLQRLLQSICRMGVGRLRWR